MAHDTYGERILKNGIEIRLRPRSKGLPDGENESVGVLEDSIQSALSLVAFYKGRKQKIDVWIEEGRFEKALRSRAWPVKSKMILSGTPSAEDTFSLTQEKTLAAESRGFASTGMRLSGWK